MHYRVCIDSSAAPSHRRCLAGRWCHFEVLFITECLSLPWKLPGSDMISETCWFVGWGLLWKPHTVLSALQKRSLEAFYLPTNKTILPKLLQRRMWGCSVPLHSQTLIQFAECHCCQGQEIHSWLHSLALTVQNDMKQTVSCQEALKKIKRLKGKEGQWKKCI